MLRVFAEEGLGCDVASGGELHLALQAGFAPERIYLHGNAKSEAELAQAVDAGVGWIVVDNADDVAKLGARARRRRAASACCCASRPGVDADTHAAILTGHAESKFGFDPREARALAADPPAHLDVQGFHFHLGSQLFDPTPYRAAVGVLAGLGDLPVYSLGGGFAVAYTADDRPPGIDGVGRRHGRGRPRRARRRQAAGDRAGPLARRQRRRDALHGASRSRSCPAAPRIVAVDGGMSDNLRPMLYDAVYDVARRRPLRRRAGEPATVVGKHCESGDVLVRRARCPTPRPGDVLVTPVTGAYGHAMANNYNGVPRPPVVFCAGGDARVVVRRETYEDLRARDV